MVAVRSNSVIRFQCGATTATLYVLEAGEAGWAYGYQNSLKQSFWHAMCLVNVKYYRRFNYILGNTYSIIRSNVVRQYIYTTFLV